MQGCPEGACSLQPLSQSRLGKGRDLFPPPTRRPG
jgi:hypothetical protein